MSEMGYFPGIRQLLEDSRQKYIALKDQNNKLIADNTVLQGRAGRLERLYETLRTSQEHNSQSQQISHLVGQIDRLQSERDALLHAQQQQCVKLLPLALKFTDRN